MTGLLRDLIGSALVVAGVVAVTFAAFAWDWRAGTAVTGLIGIGVGIGLGMSRDGE